MAWTPTERYSATGLIVCFILLFWYLQLYRPQQRLLHLLRTTPAPSFGGEAPRPLCAPALSKIIALHDAVIIHECICIEETRKAHYTRHHYKMSCEGDFGALRALLRRLAELDSVKIASCALTHSDADGHSKMLRCVYEIYLYTTKKM